VRNERYERAEQLGVGTVLILTEGQSADTMVQVGRRDPKCGLGTKKYGTFFLGGVPMNARKEVEVRHVEGYDPIKVQSKRLVNNQSFQEFVTIVGLDFNKKYETRKEADSLKYQEFWLVVDEDLDGRGAICGLFLNFIELFWPNLFKHGMVKRLHTPVVRLYPKSKKNNKVLEFFDEVKAKEFLAQDDNAEKYKINYYKGLAGHEDFETINIFKNYKTNLITYTLDNGAHAAFEMYYADLTAPRKVEFSTPVRELTVIEKDALEKNKIMTCSTQLQVYTKEYKLDNLIRKLPSIVDGFVVTRRRILYSALIHFGAHPEVLKVFQFGGVAAQNGYHHGNESLYDIIIKMAQFYNGGPIMPLLEGKGQLGSSRKGGHDAGGARYVGVSLNKALTSKLFPTSDTSVLYYIWEDGKRSIPLYYTPIVPMVLFRSEKIPADGWSYIAWARDIPATLVILRDMIKGNMSKGHRLPPSNVGFKGQFSYKDGDEYTLGTYTANEREITITALPLRVWSKSYINNFCKVEEFKDANRPGVVKKRIIEDEYADEYKDYFIGEGPGDKCSNNDVRIVFTLKPGALEKIKLSKDTPHMLAKVQGLAEKLDKVIKPEDGEDDEDNDVQEIHEDIKVGDAIQRFFGLVVKMRHNLNIITKDGAVKEYSTYEEILHDWFPIRKEMYEKRIHREIVLLKIESDYLKEQLRFCQQYTPIGMSDKLTADQMNIILEKNKFLKVCKKIYMVPGYLDENPTESLHASTFGGADADYIYLLHLHSLDRSVESQKKLEDKISSIEKTLTVLLTEWNTDSFHGASQWMRELNDFEKIYNEGIKTSWRFGKDDNIIFEAK
jgi:DNA topoisomerase-2